MNKVENCPFCQIIRGELAAQIVFQDDLVTAFWDIHPVAPVHILIVPNQHIPSLDHLSNQDTAIIGALFSVAREIAVRKKIEKSGYRLVINNGQDAGQSIAHLHLHLLGGKSLPLKLG